MFLQILFATPPIDIRRVSDNATHGITLNLQSLIKIFTLSETYQQFLKTLLHTCRLPNPLLKALLVIAIGLIQTGKKHQPLNNEKCVSPPDLARKLQNPLFTTKVPVIRNNEVNTLGLQMVHPRFMSADILKERLQMLMDAGCSLNDNDPVANTILHFLIAYERDELVSALLEFNQSLPKEKQLDVNIRNSSENSAFPDGRTPLILAVQTFRPLATIESLLTAGCHPDIQDNDGLTALHHAVIMGVPMLFIYYLEIMPILK